MKHCDEILLDKFLTDRLEAKERLACRAHLLVCTDCRAALDRVKEDKIFVGEFRRGFLEMEKACAEAESLEHAQAQSVSQN